MPIKTDITSQGFTNVQAQAIAGSIATGLTALGSTQATAAVCEGSVNVFSTVAASTGVVLGAPIPAVIGSPVAAQHALSILSAGDSVLIANHGANTLSVYPPVGGKIDNGTANTAVTVAVNTAKRFTFISNKDCITG